MDQRSNLSPATLPVHMSTDGIRIEYLDGRRVTYTATPHQSGQTVRTPRNDHVHVLIVNKHESRGTLVYLNDLNTTDEILETSGVGRVFVEPTGAVTVAPGVDVRREGEQLLVEVGDALGDRTVIVFVENQTNERAYRLRPPSAE